MIHPLADVRSHSIGEGTSVWQFSIILPGAVIGNNCNVNCHVFVENDVIVGNNVTIKSGVQLWDGIRISDGVFIGPNVTFTNDLTPRSKKYPREFEKTIVEEGASMGANSTILCGIKIGKFAMIGAGSLIAKSIPAFTLWFGNPAVQRGFVTRDGKLLNLNLQGKEGEKYQLIKGEPLPL
jgi:UDP-2-acetamido-3-amino-2,3-dideoxy-glucuronate N-acetyltransferase